ncbi:MAG: glutathione S-transferase family protein [Leptolyngbyaceae cyanobacterium CSU_1_4]|nr:glutathione S-transferase family protein [Leptolyngbyaceae cyanobacterium CSU_1_4]
MSPLILIIGNKNYSSWSMRPWLVLKQVEADFSEIRIPLNLPETRNQILRYSPTGRVPVLQQGTLKIWDSLAICEYVAEQFSESLLWPQDSETRAIARAVSAEMHSGFQQLRQHLPMNCRDQFSKPSFSLEVQNDIDRILALWQTCRRQYGTGGNFLFGHFTIADAMFAPVASRFVTYNVPLDPLSQAYIETIWALPTMKQWLAEAEAEAEHIETFQP